MTLLILLASASAGPPPGGQPTACETVPPGKNQYRLAVGYATARGLSTPAARNAALAAARLDARQQLADQLCAAMPDTCARYRGYIQDWQTPGVYDTGTKQACATAVIESWLLQPDALRREAETQMSALADAAAKVAGTAAVRIGDVRRTDGCAVPELDPARMWVGARLGAAGATVYGDEAPEGTARLELSATVAADTVTLGATVRHADGRAVWVAPVRFPAAAFGVPERQICAASVASAGLDAEGVRLTVHTRGGALCDGQPFEPILWVDRPSRVHVYDVAADGTAYHIWPEPGGDGSVSGALSLGTSYATPAISTGDEVLVAVAVPAGSGPSALDGATGFCRMARPFSIAALPAGSRVSTVSWHIDGRVDACGAPPASSPTAAQLQAAIAAAPVCE